MSERNWPTVACYAIVGVVAIAMTWLLRPGFDCPVSVRYTKAAMAAADADLAKLPRGSIVEKMIIDYGALRARVNECRK